MSGSNFVLDSNAVIYASNGSVDPEKLVSADNRYYISIISFIEVYGFDFVNPEEKETIDNILANVEILDLNREIADQTVIYRKHPVKKIKLPDAVILATAKYLKADLITDNFSDFQNIDASINILNLDDFRITK